MGKDRRKDRGLTERNISEKKAERRRYNRRKIGRAIENNRSKTRRRRYLSTVVDNDIDGKYTEV